MLKFTGSLDEITPFVLQTCVLLLRKSIIQLLITGEIFSLSNLGTTIAWLTVSKALATDDDYMRKLHVHVPRTEN